MPTAIHITRIKDTPVGPVQLAGTTSGIVRVQLGDDDERLKALLSATFPGAHFRRANALTVESGRVVRRYLNGGPDPQFPVVILDQGFSSRVWRYLPRIPRGQVRTYGAVARAIRKPTAARAVGGACGRNPLPLVCPCHRVVGAGRSLAGFTGGIDKKRFLLALEGVEI